MSELPDGWIKVPLGEVNEFSGSTVNPASRPDELFELYSVPSFPTGKPERLRGSEIGSTKQTVNAGDVLISKINPRINRVWTVGPKSSEEQIASSEWIGFRSEAVKPAFANYYFRSQEFRDLLCSEVAGVGGSLTRAQPKRVAAYPLPIAPLAEQTRIADQLDTLLTRVNACNDHLDAIPGILKRFRQAVLSAATTGALTADYRASNIEEEALGAPKGWRRVTFSDVCREITVGFVGKMADQYRDEGVPFLRSMNVRPLRFDPKGLLYVSEEFHSQIAKSALQPGDLAIVRTGAPGVCCVIPEDLPRANCSDLVIARPGPDLVPGYGCIVMNSSFASEYVRTVQVGVAQAHFNVGSMKVAPLPLPPLDEQREIVRRVEALFSLIDSMEVKYQAACAHVQRLSPQILAKAFRGELVEQDPNDETAGDLLARLRIQRAISSTEKAPRRARQPRTTRAHAKASSMTKSRQDEDVKGQPYLAGHLRRLGVPTTAQSLFKEAELPVADFYKQLAWEIAEGHVKDNQTTLEPGHATG